MNVLSLQLKTSADKDVALHFNNNNLVYGKFGLWLVAVVRAVAFHLCGAGSISWPTVICGLSLICRDSVSFFSGSGRAHVPGYKKWDFNEVVIIIIIIIII